VEPENVEEIYLITRLIALWLKFGIDSMYKVITFKSGYVTILSQINTNFYLNLKKSVEHVLMVR
jgi:hypothetical protein